jgi:hypothetical protein
MEANDSSRERFAENKWVIGAVAGEAAKPAAGKIARRTFREVTLKFSPAPPVAGRNSGFSTSTLSMLAREVG